MEVVSLIISSISLIVTSLFAFFEIRNNTKLNKINLESEYIKEIYKDYLTVQIPTARNQILFDAKGNLTDVRMLQSCVNEMRRKSRYFKYADNKFYVELKKLLQDLEDYLVQNEGKFFQPEDHNEVLNHIEKKLGEIYTHINNKYKNG